MSLDLAHQRPGQIRIKSCQEAHPKLDRYQTRKEYMPTWTPTSDRSAPCTYIPILVRYHADPISLTSHSVGNYGSIRSGTPRDTVLEASGSCDRPSQNRTGSAGLWGYLL